MSPLLNNLADTVDEELQECGLQTPTWRGIESDENKMAALGRVMEVIIKNQDDLPDELTQGAKTIVEMSSGIKWITNNRKNFKRVIGLASILVVVLWQWYNKSTYRSLGWPTKLRPSINDLTDTIQRINKLLERKFKSFSKGILQGYYVRDHGKFKKYQRRLESVASHFESKPSNIKISKALQEVLDSQASQCHDENTELSEPPAGNLPVKEGTQKSTVIKEPTAEGSNTQRKTAAVNLANPSVDSSSECEEDDEIDEIDETESSTLGETKAKNNWVNDNSEVQCAEELKRSTEDSPLAKKKTYRRSLEHAQPELKGTKKDNKWKQDTTRKEDKGKKEKPAVESHEEEKRTWRPGPPANGNTAPSKAIKKLSKISEDKKSNDIPVNDPVPSRVPLKKKPAVTPKQTGRSQTAPPQSSISGFSFNNGGSGTMINKDVGNVYHATISNVGNDNSYKS